MVIKYAPHHPQVHLTQSEITNYLALARSHIPKLIDNEMGTAASGK